MWKRCVTFFLPSSPESGRAQRMAIIWECSLQSSVGIQETAEELSEWLDSDSLQLGLGDKTDLR